MEQQNLCQRSDSCKQANDGQLITGNDTLADGFNDQSNNIQQQHAEPTSQATGNGTKPTPTPTPQKPPSFSDPVPLDNSIGDQTDPHIASSGSSVYAVSDK